MSSSVVVRAGMILMIAGPIMTACEYLTHSAPFDQLCLLGNSELVMHRPPVVRITRPEPTTAMRKCHGERKYSSSLAPADVEGMLPVSCWCRGRKRNMR